MRPVSEALELGCTWGGTALRRHHGNRQEAVSLRPREAFPGAVGEKDRPKEHTLFIAF